MSTSVRFLCRSAVSPYLKCYARQLTQSRFYFNERRVSLLAGRTLPWVSDDAIFQKSTIVLRSFGRPSTSTVTTRCLSSKVGEEAKNKSISPGLSPEEKPSLYQRFKSMYKDYWYVLIPVHVVTSCLWFGSFYYVAQSGFDIASALQILNLSDEVMEKIRHKTNSTAGHLALSYLLYKIFTPLRYTATVGGTTFAIKYFTERGLLKKIPKKEELKKMMENSKGSFKDKRENLKKVVEKFSSSKKSN